MTHHDHPSSTRPDRRAATVGRAVAKTAATGAAIAALAFGVALVGSDGEVSQSHADIFDLRFGSAGPDQESFQDSLQSLGHDQPRSYELNGNIVHFSVDYTSGSPEEVAEEYQREFVRNNINDRIYDSLDPDLDRELTVARLTGQIAPVRLDTNQITMGAMITADRAADEDDLLEIGGQLHRDDEIFRAHRWIEFHDQPDANETKVLATWSDENFSFDNMLPGGQSRTEAARRQGTDTEVPACPGCVRVHQFDDLQDDSDYTTNIFVSHSQPEEIRQFYRRSMSRRGWNSSQFQQAHDELSDAVDLGEDRDVLYLERDDETLEIFTYPVGDGELAVQTALWSDPDRHRSR